MIIERKIVEVVNKTLDVTGITLLSIEEYEAAKEFIQLIHCWCWWWLRSPGYYSRLAAYVNDFGRVYTRGFYVNSTYIVVRPALRIANLNSLDLNTGDQIIGLAGHDWTVISDDMAICNDGIGEHCFRKDWREPDANDYEKSDVKKFLETWAEEKGIISCMAKMEEQDANGT